MANILIVYATDYHSTEKMAHAAAQGVASVPGVTAVVKTAEEAKAEDFTAADGVLFGSPVHMGSMDWRMKTMIDKVCGPLWGKDALVGKVAGVFVSGGGIGGGGAGNELTQVSLLNNAAECGMIMVPFPKTSPGYTDGATQWGSYGRSGNHDGKPVGLTDEQLVAPRAQGAHIARAALALKGANIFAGG